MWRNVTAEVPKENFWRRNFAWEIQEHSETSSCSKTKLTVAHTPVLYSMRNTPTIEAISYSEKRFYKWLVILALIACCSQCQYLSKVFRNSAVAAKHFPSTTFIATCCLKLSVNEQSVAILVYFICKVNEKQHIIINHSRYELHKSAINLKNSCLLSGRLANPVTNNSSFWARYVQKCSDYQVLYTNLKSPSWK